MSSSFLLSIVVLTAAAHADAQSLPTTQPATAPASAPATAPLVLDGVFVPVDAQEVSLKPKVFSGPFRVTQVISHGASVKTGDVLLTLDVQDIDDQILLAASELEVAQATLAKEEADQTLALKTDALSLEVRTDAVADADRNLAWWKKSEGADFLRRLDMAVQASKDAVEDQNDELEQLKKMYQSEQLTNATADIVVKRAVRQLERSQQNLELTSNSIQKRKETEYVDATQAVERAVESANHELVALNHQQTQARVARAAALLRARIGVKTAQKKLSELEQDKAALSVTAKADGIAFFGGFANNAWQGSAADALKVGERTDAGRTLVTVVSPGKLSVSIRVEESRILSVRQGQSARVSPKAIESVSLDGTIAEIGRLPGSDGSYDVKITLDEPADARLLPGMKAKVEFQPETK